MFHRILSNISYAVWNSELLAAKACDFHMLEAISAKHIDDFIEFTKVVLQLESY